MSDTLNTQKSKNIFSRQAGATKTGKTHGGVWQDKSGSRSDRTASSQPASVGAARRSEHKPPPVPPRPQSKPAAVPLQLWVKPTVKAEIQRLAEQQGLRGSFHNSLATRRATRKMHAAWSSDWMMKPR